MNQQPQANQQKYKFPQAAALEQTLIANLTANNADPKMIQAQDDERQAAAAKAAAQPAPRPGRR